MQKKVRHKTEGWTGTLEYEDQVESEFWSSHGFGFNVRYTLWQDSHKPDGTYVEDPSIVSLEELEFLPQEDKQ